MWDRINSFIEELNFPHLCGKGDYIPESLFYLLGMKANSNEPYFVGKDAAERLGYSNTKDALATHVDAEERKIRW
ncbi:BRO family protein [Clostridium cadaveris]